MDVSLYTDDDRVLESAFSLGYSVVLHNRLLTNWQNQSVPVSSLKRQATRPLLLNRVTFAVAQPSQIATIDFQQFPQVSVFAVRPMNEQTLRFILDKQITNFQVISLELCQPLLATNMRTAMKKLIGLGVVFEVEFAPLLRDTSARGNCVNQCRLVLNTFAEGVVLSTGAKNAMELRSPFDLDAFATGILGLRGVSSKTAAKLCEKIVRAV